MKTTTTRAYASFAHSLNLHSLPLKSTICSQRQERWAQQRAHARGPGGAWLSTHSSEPSPNPQETSLYTDSCSLSQGPITSSSDTENQSPKPHFIDFIYPKTYPGFTHASKPQENPKIYQETGQLQHILETLESTLH